MEIKANAKINLTLDVVKKRDDGYHEMDMIMVPLSLCDILHVEIAQEDCITCEKEAFPLDESNTIYKAIVLMREKYHIKEHFHVRVEKHIPMQAGLAGGSADGAAMLKAIVSLCKLSISEEELLAIGKQIGADVPFCIVNKPARVQGIGEKVTRFVQNCPFYVLLVKPQEGVSTGKAFSLIDFTCCKHPDVDSALKCLQDNDYETFCTCIDNTLEQSALQLVPKIATIKQELNDLGFDAVLMSGSGSTVFAITRDASLLTKAKQVMNQYAFVLDCEMI